jgi:hypothetical protein
MEYMAALVAFRTNLWLIGGIVLGCCIAAAGLGFLPLRTVRQPLVQVAMGFDALASNNLTYEIPIPAAAEFRPVAIQLRALRARLFFNANERIEQTTQADEKRRAAVQEMAETVERSTGEALDSIGAETVSMARAAESMAGVAGGAAAMPTVLPPRQTRRWQARRRSARRVKSLAPRSVKSHVRSRRAAALPCVLSKAGSVPKRGSNLFRRWPIRLVLWCS